MEEMWQNIETNHLGDVSIALFGDQKLEEGIFIQMQHLKSGITFEGMIFQSIGLLQKLSRRWISNMG